MNDLAALLSGFDVSALAPVIEGISKAVALYLSPVLLIIAIYIRLMETQVDALVSGGKYGTALRDILIWSFVLGAYFSLGSLIIGLMNPIYTWIESFGSLKTVMAVFAEFSDKNHTQYENEGVNFWNLASAPYYVMALVFYYATLIMLAFLTAFLKVAGTMVFGIAFIWGLIAIPISISNTFKILRGWAYLTAFALVWPVVQGLLLWMFTLLFNNSVDTLVAFADTNATAQAANVMLLFAVMHLLMGAVMVAAPFIANALVTNSSAAAGVVMPFVGAAIAAGAGTAKVLQTKAGAGAGMAGTLPKPMGQGPSARTSSQAGARFNSSAGGGNGGISSGGISGPSESMDALDAPPPIATTDTSKKQAQRRRGVIIRQQNKGK
jgi:hypothetical protein